MNFGILSTQDNLLLPYLIETAKKKEIKNIFVFLDSYGISEKNKKIFQLRTNGRFGENIVRNEYLSKLNNLNIPFYFVDNHNSDLSLELYSLLKIDCLINGGTPRKICTKLLDRKFISKGVINIHPGKLPEYRGCSAVEWAILNDDQIFNTIHYMDAEYDTGPIIRMEGYSFKVESTYLDIRSEVYLKGIALLCDVLKDLQNKEFDFQNALKQSNLNAKYWSPIPKDLENSSIEKANNQNYLYKNYKNSFL